MRESVRGITLWILWGMLIAGGFLILRWPSCPPNCPGMWPWCCQFPGEGVPVRDISTPTPGLI